jgi:hypothetical protein
MPEDGTLQRGQKTQNPSRCSEVFVTYYETRERIELEIRILETKLEF